MKGRFQHPSGATSFCLFGFIAFILPFWPDSPYHACSSSVGAESAQKRTFLGKVVKQTISQGICKKKKENKKKKEMC